MRSGLFLSALLHVSVLLATMIVLPRWSTEVDRPPLEIPVEFEIGDVTNIKANPEPEEEEPKEEVKPEPEPEPKKVQKESPKLAAAPPAPEPAPEPEPIPVPKKAPEPKPEEKPKEAEKPKPKVTAKAAPRVKPKVPPKKKDFDLNKVAALLDKLPEKPQKKQEAEADTALESTEGPATERVGLGDAATLSLIDALGAQLQKCWSPPVGAANPEDLVVTVKISLKPDGTLADRPDVVQRERARMISDQYFRVAAEAAMRAVRRCEPYELPIEKYSIWREIEFRFDPKELLGG